MRRTGRGLAVLAALTLAAAATPPTGPAAAATVPKPRQDEWWFKAWNVDDLAWPVSRGAGVVVGLVDSGVNASLPGLRQVVLPGSDLATGDGRTDTDTEGGGHGTAMAELIAGQGADRGMVGVAPEAKILPVVSRGPLLGMSGAIIYAADHGAKVINISQASADLPIGGELCPAPLQDAIIHAARKDVVVVAGAGNEGAGLNRPMWPADCAGVLAVGAVDGRKVAWTQTQRQPYVSVAAPGFEIRSVGRDGQLTLTSGTSNATALTSAGAALVRSRNPQLTAREVVQRLINTTVDAGPAGHDDVTGSGVLFPYDAMTKSVPGTAPNPPYERLDRYLAARHLPPLRANPAHSVTASPRQRSGFNPVLLAAVVAVAVLTFIAAAIVVVLLLRRWRTGPGPDLTDEPMSDAGPPPGAGPSAPSGRVGGPPPSFRPPADPGPRR